MTKQMKTTLPDSGEWGGMTLYVPKYKPGRDNQRFCGECLYFASICGCLHVESCRWTGGCYPFSEACERFASDLDPANHCCATCGNLTVGPDGFYCLEQSLVERHHGSPAYCRDWTPRTREAGR
ncbi:MAG: hypothetical protein AB7E32_17725 [Desulfovibrio sp.]